MRGGHRPGLSAGGTGPAAPGGAVPPLSENAGADAGGGRDRPGPGGGPVPQADPAGAGGDAGPGHSPPGTAGPGDRPAGAGRRPRRGMIQAVEKVLPAEGFGGRDSLKGDRQGPLFLKSLTF